MLKNAQLVFGIRYEDEKSKPALICVANKGRVRLPNQMNFWKHYKRGGGSFSVQKLMLQILGTLNRFFDHEIDTK